MSAFDYDESKLLHLTRETPNMSGLYIAFDYEEANKNFYQHYGNINWNGFILKIGKNKTQVKILNPNVYLYGDKMGKSFMEVLDNQITRKNLLFAVAMWDGQDITFRSREFPVENIKKYHDTMDEVFKNLPEVPEGLDGWWKIK